MNIDINKIASEKIQELKDSGAIKDRIEKGVEKTVMEAIDSALGSYDIKRTISDIVKISVSDVASQIGFSAYNGFIAEKIKQITEGAMRADVSAKIQKTFDDMLVIKYDGIKLSEIFDKYREWLFDNVGESDKWERGEFRCELNIREDGNFTHCDVKLGEQNNRVSYVVADGDIDFSISSYLGEAARIYRVTFDGKKISENLRLGTLTDFESLIANLYYNNTKIIIDIDDVDKGCHYDIDD